MGVLAFLFLFQVCFLPPSKTVHLLKDSALELTSGQKCALGICVNPYGRERLAPIVRSLSLPRCSLHVSPQMAQQDRVNDGHACALSPACKSSLESIPKRHEWIPGFPILPPSRPPLPSPSTSGRPSVAWLSLLAVSDVRGDGRGSGGGLLPVQKEGGHTSPRQRRQWVG